jgi:hypothetical protein
VKLAAILRIQPSEIVRGTEVRLAFLRPPDGAISLLFFLAAETESIRPTGGWSVPALD